MLLLPRKLFHLLQHTVPQTSLGYVAAIELLQTRIEQHAQKRRALLYPGYQEWKGVLPETGSSGHAEEKHCCRQKQPASQERPQMYQYIDGHVFRVLI